MNFIFLSSPTFEPWDWTNPDTAGIGGSETSHIEMSNRLANRGHHVLSFAPMADDGPVINPHGVIWSQCKHADPSVKGIWVIYRDPTVIDGVPEGQPAWLICQDVDYPTLTPERAARFTRIVALCETHAKYLRAAHPYAADKVYVSSNGIKAELIREALKNPPARNPRRLMYASSPDRGLLYLAMIFERAKEILPDLELHFYYGFDNLDKVIMLYPGVQIKVDQIRAMLNQPGIVNHGRTGQPALIQEWLKSGIWCHPSSFTETSCITCMDAQALGAIPITTPVWAISENVEHGVFIEGDPYQEELTRARYVLELVKLAADPIRQGAIRETMMPWALDRFGWERYVDQWEAWAREDFPLSWSGDPARNEAKQPTEAKA